MRPKIVAAQTRNVFLCVRIASAGRVDDISGVLITRDSVQAITGSRALTIALSRAMRCVRARAYAPQSAVNRDVLNYIKLLW